jgi:hypothetical protein
MPKGVHIRPKWMDMCTFWSFYDACYFTAIIEKNYM